MTGLTGTVRVRREQAQQGASTPQTARSTKAAKDAAKTRGLSAVDEALLATFTTFRLMTAAQMTRLHYAAASLEWVRKRLNGLVTRGLLHKFQAPSRGSGNSAYVYTLSRKGIRLLGELGVVSEEQLWKVRPGEQSDAAYTFLEHSLGLTDVLVSCRLLEAEDPGVVVAELAPDWRLKHTPMAVTTYKGERLRVVPDALVRLELGGKAQMTVVWEYDRATMEGAAMRRKLRALLAAYGKDGYTIAFATTGGVRRAEALRGWCEQVLKEAQQEAMADLFLFTALPTAPKHTAPLPPKTLFFAPIWSVPFADSLVPLIER